MHFKHPEVLYALFALLIPILVHLFQLRRFQKVTFSNVAFLQRVTVQSRKSSQIKKWLTLLMRMLAFAFLIIAFAQPYFADEEAIGSEHELVIYLDNSFSMSAIGSQGPLYQRAVQELLDSNLSDEKITVFTNDRLFRIATISEMKEELLKSSYSPNQLSFSTVLAKANQYFSKQQKSRKNFLYVSDFQQQDQPLRVENESVIQTTLVKKEPVSKQNIAITNIQTKTINPKKVAIQITLKGYNLNKAAKNVVVSLYDEEKLLGKTSETIENQSLVTFEIPIAPVRGIVRIDDTDLPYDNVRYFSINPLQKIKVLSITESQRQTRPTEENYLKRIYTEAEFEYETVAVNKLNYSTLETTNFVILEELLNIPISLQNTLQTFVSNGGTVCWIPHQERESTGLRFLTYSIWHFAYHGARGKQKAYYCYRL